MTVNKTMAYILKLLLLPILLISRYVKAVTQNMARIYILKKVTADNIPAEQMNAMEISLCINELSVKSMIIFLKKYNVPIAKTILIRAANQILKLPGKREQIVCKIK